MKTHRSSSLCIILTLAAFGNTSLDAQEKSPTESLDQRYAAAIRKADDERTQSLERAKTMYVEELEKSLVTETKAGNLDAAVAIRDRMRSLADAEPSTDSILTRLRGTNWVNANGVEFQWTKDGACLHSGKPRPCFLVAEDSVAIPFSASHIDVIKFNAELTSFEQYNCRNDGKPLFTGRRARFK